MTQTKEAKQTKSCDCLIESEKKMIAHVKEALSKEQSVDSWNERDSGYTTKAFFFTGGTKLTLPFEVKYTPLKKDGTQGKEKVYKTSILPSYCPFCGKPL
jgi:hypothetical protein